jgi:hypothetical protein
MAGAMLAILGIIYLWADRFSGWAWVPLIISTVGLAVSMSLRSKVAMKTHEGAEVAMKWKAYRRYLRELRTGPDRDRYIEVVMQDLPWAVALGVQSSWASLAGSTTRRFGSWRSGSAYDGSTTSMAFGGAMTNDGSSQRGNGSSGEEGGLQGASNQALAAISGGSAGMFALLNDAAATLSFSGSSGGSSSVGDSGSGGSFSGSSDSGSSGGGDHSFS